ncbi:MAG: 2-oxoacid:acceptor oxidoreductase subunit alpha [Anaerolineae bacterium]|nr:2-oxoacid:acceptor oxidoreductase subunit alpha [Anaerolineae bacterium]
MTQTESTVVVRVGGEGGEGTITIGDIFSRIAARAGLEVYSFRTYPSEIKGGQVLYQARIGTQRVMSEGDEADVLVAMNQQAWTECNDHLCSMSTLIYDTNAVEVPESYGGVTYPIPATEIATDLDWARGKNFVLLGALTCLFNFDWEMTKAVVERRMQRHKDTLTKNLAALRKGYEYIQEHYTAPFDHALPLPDPDTIEERILITGAEAMAMGALAAGCQFYSGYPITPATPIMETLAKYLPSFGGTLVQAEDEIASINMIIGAAFAGKKAMTATSGPGFSLMIEALGLAGITEVPIVLVNVQRAGPSTGLPTKTSQGDLFLTLYGGHGDAPRFVIAPDSVKDCYYSMINAFSLAEYFQTPVIVLSDQAMASRLETMPWDTKLWNPVLERRLPTEEELAEDYRRYKDTEDGISSMALPGMSGGIYLAESLEHNEYGYPDQDPANHEKMMKKRAKKTETARKLLKDWASTARRWGEEDAAFGIIGWGSTRGAVREAMDLLQKRGIKVEAIYPHTLLPMPDEAMLSFFKHKKAVLVPELNFSSQLARMVEHRYYKALYKLNIQFHTLAKEQGVPFKVQEICDAVVKMIAEEEGC